MSFYYVHTDNTRPDRAACKAVRQLVHTHFYCPVIMWCGMRLKDRDSEEAFQQTVTMLMFNNIYTVVKRPTTVLTECPRLSLTKMKKNIAFQFFVNGRSSVEYLAAFSNAMRSKSSDFNPTQVLQRQTKKLPEICNQALNSGTIR